MKPLLLLFGTLLAVAVALGEEPRIWTSSGGSEREAAFVALEGETLVLEVEDRILRTPIGLFSERDQAHARQLAKQQIDSSSDTQPLQVFDGPSFSGREALLETDRIYRGNEIPGQLDAKISSLVLKKGYQLTIGIHEDGSGLSKVLIAIKRDIRIRELSAEFNNRIRYIRVLPWRNVIKKGHGGQGFEGLNEGYYYLWSGMGETIFVRMRRNRNDPKAKRSRSNFAIGSKPSLHPEN